MKINDVIGTIGALVNLASRLTEALRDGDTERVDALLAGELLTTVEKKIGDDEARKKFG